MAGLLDRPVGPTAPSHGHLQLELVQALAVVGQRHQVPLAGHLVEAAQREAGEAEHRLDDAEDRLDLEKIAAKAGLSVKLLNPVRLPFDDNINALLAKSV